MGEEINRMTTEIRRTRTLGKGARCPDCGFSEPMALRKDDQRCYECGNAAGGRTTVERHHPIGRANDPHTIVATPGNMHRLLDARKAAWPVEMRTNPMHDPLISVTQITLALRDFALVIAQYAQTIADWLRHLREALCERFGATWWEALGLPTLWATARGPPCQSS